MPKFATVNLHPFFNTDRNPGHWLPQIREYIPRLPAGQQTFWGIPFDLGTVDDECWFNVGFSHPSQEVPLGCKANYLVFAHFCDKSVDPQDTRLKTDYKPGEVTSLGEHLADYVLFTPMVASSSNISGAASKSTKCWQPLGTEPLQHAHTINTNLLTGVVLIRLDSGVGTRPVWDRFQIYRHWLPVSIGYTPYKTPTPSKCSLLSK